MKAYSEEYFKKIRYILEQKAEDLVNENTESQTDQVLEVEILGELLEFRVDLEVSNYEYDENTDKTSYDCKVIVTETPDFEDLDIRGCFIAEFYNEQIY